MKLIKRSFLYTNFSRAIHFFRLQLNLARLKRNRGRVFTGNKSSNLIVSLTSYPARIDDVWITIESLFMQNYQPWKVVLVLAETEFPGKKLPTPLNDQINRGLEIIWTDKNTKSYKKLLPVREKYPDSFIITVDDDIIYESSRIEKLINGAKDNPRSVVGCRGKEIIFDGNDFNPYMTWPLAGPSTPTNKTMLTGIGGILYPPGLIGEEMLLDIDAAERFAPMADDIWFWASTICSDVPVKCLGYNKHLSIKFREMENSLTKVNCIEGGNDKQMEAIEAEYKVSRFVTR